jgi:biopolymer transport protein ExbB/TolQ
MEELFKLIGTLDYIALAVVAVWGAFSAVLAWRRVAQVRFKNESVQDEFLDEVDSLLLSKRFKDVTELCENDRRALPQLATYAVELRDLEFPSLRRRLHERFQQDVIADLEHRLSWVATVIKTAPMLGLFGTVIGMMGAFANLSTGTNVDPAAMAENIMLALITTAVGLAIAVPLLVVSAGIQVRMRKTEDLVAIGLARLLDTMKSVHGGGAGV